MSKPSISGIVLTHYYQLGERELKQQFLGKLPAELIGAMPARRALGFLAASKLCWLMNAENWEAIRVEFNAVITDHKQSQ